MKLTYPCLPCFHQAIVAALEPPVVKKKYVVLVPLLFSFDSVLISDICTLKERMHG